MFFCKTIHQHLNMHFDSFTLLSTLFTCFPRFSFRCPCLSPRSLSVTTGDISHLWPQIRWLMEAASRQPGFTYTISNSNSSHMGKWRQLFFLLVIYQERRKRRAPNAVIFIIDCSTVKAAAAVTAQSIEMKGCTTATIIGFYTSFGEIYTFLPPLYAVVAVLAIRVVLRLILPGRWECNFCALVLPKNSRYNILILLIKPVYFVNRHRWLHQSSPLPLVASAAAALP